MKFLKVTNIKLHIDSSNDDAIGEALKIAGVHKKDFVKAKIIKRSIDARNKANIRILYAVGLTVHYYDKTRNNVQIFDHEPRYHYEPTGQAKMSGRPVVVGFGPAGIFCSYLLALHGFKPIIIERGSDVETRLRDVEHFWETGELNENSNVQFGEGGAGTFSDGKLNTGIKDKENRIQFVLETFVKFGAPENILYDAKPHIGTDILRKVVKNIREYIKAHDGTFYFDTCVNDFVFEKNRLTGVITNNGDIIDTNHCILAIGHSARDTFQTLYEKGVNMEQKPFALGVRIEHKQKTINQAQYGFSDNRLGAAPYKLTYKTKEGRGVYSFCMCPGGYVVNSSSEKNGLCVNGMSYSGRNGENANSAIVVTVTPKDFPTTHPLSGVTFQRDLENKAYLEGDGNIPVQTFACFKNGQILPDFGEIVPNIKGHYQFSDINRILPKYICDSIKEGMEHFGHIIAGFDADDVILSAIEARTSSPVRIIRDENFESNIAGLYPAGEGAGYAGGITSAAIDGMKIFEYIGKNYCPNKV